MAFEVRLPIYFLEWVRSFLLWVNPFVANLIAQMKEFVTQLESDPPLCVSRKVSGLFIELPSLYLFLSFFALTYHSLFLSPDLPTPFHTISFPFYRLLLVGLSSWVAVFPKRWAPFLPIFLIRWDPLHIFELSPLELVPTSKSMLGRQISPRHYVMFLVMPWVGSYYTMLGPFITCLVWLWWAWLTWALALGQYLIYGPYNNI